MTTSDEPMSLSDTADALLESLTAGERDATLLSAQAMCEEHDPVTLACHTNYDDQEGPLSP